MELDERELLIVNLLAAEWETSGPPGFVETAVIAEKLKISAADARTALRSLFTKGLVGTDQVDTYAAYLTPEGYEAARTGQSLPRHEKA
jgi:Mn-dependent DtxR family transcriptional regulator